MDNHILVIIIILIIIVITLYVNKHYINKEGLRNPFDFIIKIFKFFGTIFGSIFTIFSLIGDIFNIISCPHNIFANIGTCTSYWFFDILFMILYYIFFGIFLWPVSQLITLGFMATCFSTGRFCNKSMNPKDICTKYGFFKFWDYLYSYIFNTRFLYRDKSDISKCYCAKALKKALDPLESRFNVQGVDKSGNSANPMLFFISVIILFVLYIKSKNE